MRRFLLFLICFAGITAASAQYTSRNGFFQVDEVKGCAPFTVTITDTNLRTTNQCTSGPTGIPCNMDFLGDGVLASNRFSFTYNTPGTYKLSVNYQSIGPDDITITVTGNNAPPFEVYTCIGDEVSIKVTDKTFDTYLIDFDNNNIVDSTIPSGNNAVAHFDYPSAGTYTIAVRGKNVNAADNCPEKTENFTTRADLPPASITTMTAVDANNLKIDMTMTPHIQYKLEIALNTSAAFQVYQDLYQVNTITVPNLLVDANYYCFRIAAFDPCTGINYYGNTVCSQDFDVAFENGVNNLTWKTSTSGATSTEIRRNGTLYATIAGTQLNYPDSDYDCNKEYGYQLTTLYGTARSISLLKSGIGKLTTTFPAIDYVSAVVRDGVELLWEADPTIDIRHFEIFRSEPGQPLSFHALTTEEKFIDATYNYQGGMCYQVNYTDFCNNRSEPGIVACPVVLTASLDDKNGATLNWTRYTGWNSGVNTYQVNKFSADGAPITTFTTTDTTFIDYDPADNHQIVIYSITAIPNVGRVDQRSVSNQVKLEKEVKLILPTAFTPNGDGINPLFTISGKFVSKMSIQIFDRWGVLVFSSDKNEPWDGTRAGKVMPESAYVWKAEVVDFAGHTFSKEGTVLLLRPPR